MVSGVLKDKQAVQYGSEGDAIGVLLLYPTPLVSGAGGLVGAWGGSLIRTERWRALSLQTRVGVVPGPGVGLDSGFSLSISVRLGAGL